MPSRPQTRSILALGMAVVSSAAAQSHEHGMTRAALVPLYRSLGSHHYAITTTRPLAQRYFDQGLRLTWAFNHPEAIRAFEEGERLDSTCAMCAWGIALASGPNIHLGMDTDAGTRAWKALERAHRHKNRVSARERLLIEALATRYAPVPPVHRAGLDSGWANAMGRVAAAFPDDQEIQVLHADALMNLRPLDYWDAVGEERPGTRTILQRLEGVLRVNAIHPGACHLLIHAVEAVHPRRAQSCAERLAAIMPGAGHLVHMPAHLYLRAGRYAEAIRAAEQAARADVRLLDETGALRRGSYAGGYTAHHLSFLSFALTMTGRSEAAITAAREAAKRLDAAPGRSAPWVDAVLPGVPLTLLTFGRWADVLAEPAPGEASPQVAGMVWYARGVAHAALGDAMSAQRAVEALQVIADDQPRGDARTLLQIALHALHGELSMRARQHLDNASHAREALRLAEDAIKHFAEAVRLESALTFHSPPLWYYPVRHSLGQALLAADRPAEAERAYREDLRQFPENGWSLLGLAQSLTAQDRTREAEQVLRRYRIAWSEADVPLAGSRF